MITVKKASGRQLSGKLFNKSSGFEMHKDMGTAAKNHLFLLFFFFSLTSSVNCFGGFGLPLVLKTNSFGINILSEKIVQKVYTIFKCLTEAKEKTQKQPRVCLLQLILLKLWCTVEFCPCKDYNENRDLFSIKLCFLIESL